MDEALTLTNKAVIEALDGLPPAKVHCSVLAEEAVKAAIADYYRKNGMEDKIDIPCTGCCSSCAMAHEHGAAHDHDIAEED